MGSSRSKRIENSRTASGDGNKGMFVGDQDHGLPTFTKLEPHSHRLPSEKLVLQGQLQRRHATGKRWGGWGGAFIGVLPHSRPIPGHNLVSWDSQAWCCGFDWPTQPPPTRLGNASPELHRYPQCRYELIAPALTLTLILLGPFLASFTVHCLPCPVPPSCPPLRLPETTPSPCNLGSPSNFATVGSSFW